MTWYNVSAQLNMVLFVTFLLCTAGQLSLAMNSGEMIRGERGLLFFRLYYLLLAFFSLTCAAELLMVIASIEGGLYLPIPSVLRYAFVLPALFYLYRRVHSIRLPESIKPAAAGLFIPLLRLPFADRLPAPLPVVLSVAAAAWLLADLLWMLLSIRRFMRSDITRNILLHVVHELNHGVCIADFRGQILEYNPAFEKLLQSLGIESPDRVCELDAQLRELQNTAKATIANLQDGQIIPFAQRVYFLRREPFMLRDKELVQIALSDITESYHKARSLERKNEQLVQKNRELEKVMENAAAEAALQERERLCRASHDHWSQRLAVAGLSLDLLIRADNTMPQAELREILSLLESPEPGEYEKAGGLSGLLAAQTGLYQRLGVDVVTTGSRDFSQAQQKALSHVLREALANAVRHAYARQIQVCFFEDDQEIGMTVQNACPDNETVIAGGRGLHDMMTRMRDSGGSLEYKKNETFLLRAAFRKKPLQEQEVLTE